ncbi:MAG TPA: G5 domain-containing protein [Limnochordia bacterium]
MAGVLAIALLVAVAAGWSPKKVTIIVENGEPVTAISWGRSVEDALAEAGITLDPGDRVIPDLTVLLQPRMEIRVLRAFPVTLYVDGRVHHLRAVREPIAEVLLNAGVVVGERDIVTPSLETLATPGAEIRVVRVREEVVTVQEPIAFKTIQWAAPDLVRGRTRLIRAGVPGLEERSVRIRYEDGREVEREILSREVLKPPVDEIVGVGTRAPARVVRTPEGLLPYERVITVEATAYYPGPESTGDSADGLTATGIRARRGIVAVDPRVIPLGSRLYIPGYGVALAADIGGAIQGYRVDLCFDTYEEAIHYGRRKVQVYILEGH